MSQQKVLRLPSKGAGYEALEEKSEDIPKVQPHEVLIKVHGKKNLMGKILREV